MENPVETKESDLSGLSDGDLLSLLDRVSEEIKRRNNLLPRTAGSAAVEVVQALHSLVTKR